MDLQPHRREQNMARWTFAGSLGVVAGPLILNLAVWLRAGWRGLYGFFALLAVLLLGIAWRFRISRGVEARRGEEGLYLGLRNGLKMALRALQRREAWRWLAVFR